MKKIHFEDIRAGLVVFLVALPLCLGVALASNASPLSGLFAGVIGGIVVGFISNSRLSVTGPAAGLTSILVAAVAGLNDFHLIALAVMIAGVIQIILGIIKAGLIVNFFPSSAIKGMLCGIGIILIIKQIPHFFGYDKDPEGDLDFFQVDGENSFSEMVNAINFICPPSLLIGIVSVVILILWETKLIKKNRILSNVPAPLLVVTLAIVLNEVLYTYGGVWIIEPEHMVNFPSVLEANTASEVFIFPDMAGLQNPEVYKVALIIAVVASIETLLCIEAVDKLDPEKHNTNTNRELLAQGTGNMLSGLIGGLPVTSVIVRSSANLNAGAKTKMSTIFHGLFLLTCILFIPDLLKMIPNSALAAILIITGYKLARISIFRNAWHMGWKHFLPFVATIGVMLFTDLLKGVGTGIIIAFIFILLENMRIPFHIIRERIADRNIVKIQLAQHVTFLHKARLKNEFMQLPDGAHLIVDANKTTYIDRDVNELFAEFKATAHHRNIKVEYLNIKDIEIIGGH